MDLREFERVKAAACRDSFPPPRRDPDHVPENRDRRRDNFLNLIVDFECAKMLSDLPVFLVNLIVGKIRKFIK